MEISKSKEWHDLQLHYENTHNVKMRDMFDADMYRFEEFSIVHDDFLFDFSKNRLTSETIGLLVKLAEKAGLQAKIDKMFAGKKINTTEQRAVLHTALRNFSDEPVKTDGVNVMPGIRAVREHIKNFVDAVRSGAWLGVTGKRITDVVNIGIGGSDLGPAMASTALKHFSGNLLNVHYVSNVDSTDILDTLENLNPETTLFVIASKTFTTQETLTNAKTAKKWFMSRIAHIEKDMTNHFVALSTNEKACVEFGISPNNMFHFWDWVGGRYSMWSAIGLSVALYVGYENFEEMLKGAFEADEHFRSAHFRENIPVLMALISVWYNNFFGAASQAVIAYDQNLLKFTEYLQQLDMESLGKSVTLSGEKLAINSGQIIWGTIGTNAQHSFFQLLHQGTRLVPADFIATIKNNDPESDHKAILLSNFFAQTEALMRGKTEEEALHELRSEMKEEAEILKLLPHKVFEGNKPTNTILINELTPKSLGKLIAFYEHKVFTEGAIWDINPFDQWGVELGKQLAKRILPELAADCRVHSHDSSTNGLINYSKTKRYSI